MANITKVPNGPLIKKKGPFKGSTLKSGGVVKKAQEGATMSPYMQKRAAQQLVKEKNIRARDSILNRNASAKGMTREQVQAQQVADKNKPDAPTCDTNDPNFKATKCGISKAAAKESKSDWKKKRNGGPIKKAQNGTSKYSDPKPLFDKIKKSKDSLDNATFKLEEKKFKSNMKYLNGRLKNEQSIMNTKKVKKAKAGAMIKRADGSMSRHGLWDSIRANKGSGKKPTAAMLKQEKKIKAKTKK